MLIRSGSWIGMGMTVLLTVLPLPAQAASCDAPEFATLRSSVGHHYKIWSIVTVESLSSDDQSIWKGKWGSNCPGISPGNFDGTGLPQFAVLLISGPARLVDSTSRAARRLRLVHVTADQGFKYRLLEAGYAAPVPVVRSLPPGTYFNFKPNSDVRIPFETTTDMVVLEVLEASSVAYLITASRIKQLTLSF